METKELVIIIAVFLVLMLLLISLGVVSINLDGKTISGSNSNENGNIPEKCRVPAGQELNAWKEHLGHHAETQDCLKYFN